MAGEPPAYGIEKRRSQLEEIRENIGLCDNLLAILRKASREDPRDISEELGNFVTSFDYLEISSSMYLLDKNARNPEKKFEIYKGSEWTVAEIISHVQDYVDGRNLGMDKVLSTAGVDELAGAYIKNIVMTEWGVLLYRAYKNALTFYGVYKDEA